MNLATLLAVCPGPHCLIEARQVSPSCPSSVTQDTLRTHTHVWMVQVGGLQCLSEVV